MAVPRPGWQQAATAHTEPRQPIRARHGRCRIGVPSASQISAPQLGESRSAAWTVPWCQELAPLGDHPGNAGHPARAGIGNGPPGSGTGRRGPASGGPGRLRRVHGHDALHTCAQLRRMESDGPRAGA